MSSPSGVIAVTSTFPLRLPASISSWVIVVACAQVKTFSAGQNKRSPWKIKGGTCVGYQSVYAAIIRRMGRENRRGGGCSIASVLAKFTTYQIIGKSERSRNCPKLV